MSLQDLSSSDSDATSAESQSMSVVFGSASSPQGNLLNLHSSTPVHSVSSSSGMSPHSFPQSPSVSSFTDDEPVDDPNCTTISSAPSCAACSTHATVTTMENLSDEHSTGKCYLFCVDCSFHS